MVSKKKKNIEKIAEELYKAYGEQTYGGSYTRAYPYHTLTEHEKRGWMAAAQVKIEFDLLNAGLDEMTK